MTEDRERLGMPSGSEDAHRYTDCVAAVARINQAMAVWNYDEAAAMAGEVEAALNSGATIERLLLPGIFALLARVHLNRAETKRPGSVRNLEVAKNLLERAQGLLGVAPSETLAEIAALRASVASIEQGADTAISQLEQHTDPYALRTRAALLLNQEKAADAMHLLERFEPHERWCDIAVTAYVLSDRFEKARGLVAWAAALPGRSRYAQCVVRMADAMMVHALRDHAKGENILPFDLSPQESESLVAVLTAVEPVLQPIRAAKVPSSNLDVTAIGIAYRANHLLQNRNAVAELLTLMSKWTPIPLDVARGVVSGCIKAPPDLPNRMWLDHPGDIHAGILAAAIQSGSFGQHDEAFTKAKKLVPLADDNEKKEELFSLVLQVWRSIEGPALAECEAIACQLVGHSSRLRAMFDASVALRNGDADKAIGILDAHTSAEDLYWLQLRANALLQKRQPAAAIEFLLPVAKRTREPGLLHKTGDIALRAGKHDIAVWCYERLVESQPDNLAVRGNLAHIYTFIQHDLAKAANQFRALHCAEPDNSTHTFNLAVCLAQLFEPDESLCLFNELCSQDSVSIQAVIARAQLHHSLGRPQDALAALEQFRHRFWEMPDFLLAYMVTAHAAGNDEAGHDALVALNQLRASGQVGPDSLRAMQKDEGLEVLKQSFKQAQDRTEMLHLEMLKGHMPWVWAEQMSNNAIYWGWRTRTQEMRWTADEPAHRARFSIYSTNGFHPRESEHGKRQLLPLACPSSGTKVVADISALITLDRLGLIDAAANYFGEILVPAGYLPTVLEDSRQMVLGQRSQQSNAEQIAKQVNVGGIAVVEEGTARHLPPIVDEYKETNKHRYHLIDLIRPLHQAGTVSDADLGRLSRICAKPSAVDEHHPALRPFSEVMVDLTTVETIAQLELLRQVAEFYRIRISVQAHREVLQRLNAIANQEETRQWHLGLWRSVQGRTGYRFVPHSVPEKLREDGRETKSYLPFLASFIARSTKTPLLADDRTCQAFTLNEIEGVHNAAFGSDAFVLALMAAGKLDVGNAAAAIRKLMVWRYRFIVPPAEILKTMADSYRENPPGLHLREVAEYIHDCMRDPGLFGGREKTELGESMAMRFYMAWVATIAEFLVLVWADKGLASEPATHLTGWCCRELLPSSPRAAEVHMRVRAAEMTPRLLISHALLKASHKPGDPRMADAMKAIKEALQLSDEEYMKIVTEILDGTDRTVTQP